MDGILSSKEPRNTWDHRATEHWSSFYFFTFYWSSEFSWVDRMSLNVCVGEVKSPCMMFSKSLYSCFLFPFKLNLPLAGSPDSINGTTGLPVINTYLKVLSYLWLLFSLFLCILHSFIWQVVLLTSPCLLYLSPSFLHRQSPLTFRRTCNMLGFVCIMYFKS